MSTYVPMPDVAILFRREQERARLDDLVRATAAGRSGVLRIIGERGMGKSAALDYAVGQAVGFRVLRVRTVAAERDLPYAGLHLLCAALLDDGPAMAAPHLQSLSAAFGLTGRSRPGVGFVGPAVLDLLTGLAKAQPVCVAVDDAHWLDDATVAALAFVAGHADGQAVLILLAEDAANRLTDLDGLPEMCLPPLYRDEVSALLAGAAPIDVRVADRLVAETHGNPQALAEALGALRAGGFGIPASGSRRSCAPGHDCVERAGRLTPAEFRLLLAAAAEPTGDATLLRKLAAELQTDAEVLAANRLLVIGERVTFTCPALRSVIYYSAPVSERRLVHRKLGENTYDDQPRRAWHLGLAASGCDDALADELEANAERAQSRGGIAARAAFVEIAALLTGEPVRRTDRALDAAAMKFDSGDMAGAQRMLAMVDAEPGDIARSARCAWHRARIETAARPSDGSARELLDAARRLRLHEPANGREAYLEVLLAAMSTETAAAGGTLVEAAREARAATADHRAHPVDLILHGLAVRILDGYAASVDPLRTAITAFRNFDADCRTTRWLGLAGLIAADLWDSQAWLDLARRQPNAGTGEQPGAEPFDQSAVLVAAWQGSVLRLEDRLAQMSENARGRDAAGARAVAAAVLRNAAGRYDEAVEVVRETAGSERPGLTGWALAELVEAGIRAGDVNLAADAAARLAVRTTPAGTDWALGVQATAEALLADGEQAETCYEEAIERLARAGVRCQLARAELLYGEWLRRRNRRIDARGQLRAAEEHFAALGANAFADRAHRELLATGEAARKRTVESKRQLTPQEVRVATLARDGLSNSEIAAQLFVSPRTVEYHLYKAFAKLGIASRGKLQAVRRLGPGGMGQLGLG